MIKKIFVTLILVFSVIVLSRGTDAQAASTDKWDTTQEYTVEKDSVKYYALLSKDEKESWIYKVEVLDKESRIDMVVPDKIQGGNVTCFGNSSVYSDEIRDIIMETFDLPDEYFDFCLNIFFEIHEPWHNVEGETSNSEYVNIRSIVLPDTVTDLGSGAFIGLSNLSYVHLPPSLTYIGSYTFTGCVSLQMIDLPSEFTMAQSAFEDCSLMKGLIKMSGIVKGKTLQYKDNMVIYPKKKMLIQVMPSAKKIVIPSGVKWILAEALDGNQLKKVKVSKKSKYYAVKKRCLYDKRDKALVSVFGKGATVTLPKVIKEIGEDVKVASYKIKKLVIRKKIKRYDRWKKPYISNNKKVKIYYRGKRVR